MLASFFQRFWTSIAKISVIFQGGGVRTPLDPPSESANACCFETAIHCITAKLDFLYGGYICIQSALDSDPCGVSFIKQKTKTI